MPFIQVRDLTMYYEQAGSGPRLLYISGTGGDLRRKPSIFERPVAAEFEILTFDQRGLGQTSKPEADYTMADYGTDAAALLDAAGWDRCHVMGVSFGGMVAQEMAIRYPERVDRLVLACTSTGGAGGASYPLHKHLNDTPRERVERQLALADTRRDAAWRAANPDEYATLVEQGLAGASVGADEPGRADGYRRQLMARKGLDTFERLAGVTAKTFICGGKYDGIAPISNQEALLRQLPNARLELFEGGHAFLQEDARAFERVIAFLKGELDG
ncbi:MAG: alpha/beta hydrolase [Chloroflexi bacterium]|nr:alpha/beta hydrolase [Chloroflexota bacterium]